MKCEVCQKGMEHGVNLHRQNEKGVTGIWRCDEHNQKPVDQFTKDLIELLNPVTPKEL